MYRYITFVKQIIRRLVVFTMAIAVFLLFFFPHYTLGWLAGNGINLIYFWMLAKRVHTVKDLEPERGVRMIQASSLLRFIAIVLFLIVVLQIPAIHFGATVAGILSMKLLVVGSVFYDWFRKKSL